jgi:prefoldin subunit 5
MTFKEHWRSLFHITSQKEIHQMLDKIDAQYKDLKQDVFKLQQSIDPISDLISELEKAFIKDREK